MEITKKYFELLIRNHFEFLVPQYGFQIGKFTTEILKFEQHFFTEGIEIFISCGITLTNEPKVELKKDSEYKQRVSNTIINDLICKREARLNDLTLQVTNDFIGGIPYDLSSFENDYKETGYKEFDEIFIALSNELKNDWL